MASPRLPARGWLPAQVAAGRSMAGRWQPAASMLVACGVWAWRLRCAVEFASPLGPLVSREWLWDEDKMWWMWIWIWVCTGYRPNDDVQDLPRSYRRSYTASAGAAAG
jgi:hypothetical protein